MGRRRFDHLFAEASVAAGRLLPRYELWLACHERGIDPDTLTREEAVELCRRTLPGLLEKLGVALRPRAARRLERTVARFDPRHPTPYERFAAGI
jgi:hypothetical protein